MNEKEMQKKLTEFLKKKFKKAKITSEYPFIHGTSDVIMIFKDNVYVFELKEKINKRVIEQAIKHKTVADYIFVVANIPKKDETKINWNKKIIDKKINVLWADEFKKKYIKKANVNKSFNKKRRMDIYGI